MLQVNYRRQLLRAGGGGGGRGGGHPGTCLSSNAAVVVLEIASDVQHCGITAIPQNTIRRCFGSTRRRCLACVAAHGSHTRY